MRMLGAGGCVELETPSGHVIKRQSDGTFHVPDDMGRAMKRGGDFGVAGTRMAGARGWRCVNPACRHLGVFRDRCGRCGGTELVEEPA